MSKHFNNADNISFGAEENIISYPVEQIPDQGNAQRNKSLRVKRELYWIKTLGIQFPHEMIHNIVRKHDIFFTFPFNNDGRKTFKITKEIYTKLQKMHPNVFRGELMFSFIITNIWVITLFLLSQINSRVGRRGPRAPPDGKISMVPRGPYHYKVYGNKCYQV